MRLRLPLLVLLVLFATSGFAKEVYLSIGGSANGFFTDARIVNPSFEKDIIITARYLIASDGSANNSAAAPVTITVPKRSMAVYDDVVKALFPGAPALGAIRLSSDDNFIATQRIYADKRSDRQQGTLGQFVPGLDSAAARAKGVVAQLKIGQAALGNFRTNFGAVNPNGTAANVTLRLYDKNNAVTATRQLVLAPFGAMVPTQVFGFFGSPAGDHSDAWISYESDQPILVWCSIVDNGSEDPTFVTASEDTGNAPPPTPTNKTVTVTARDFSFTVTTSGALRKGDTVKFIISAANGAHGFNFSTPDGTTLIDILTPLTSTPIERTITLPADGTYFYFCTLSSCGSGHLAMTGEMEIGGPDDPY